MPKQAFVPSDARMPYYSDLVLGYVMGSDIGHAFREVSLTMTATLQFGSVLTSGLVESAAAATADTVFVWADQPFGLDAVPVGTSFRAVVAKQDATLNRYLVVYSDGSAIDDAGVVALEAKGLKLTNKVLLPTT